MVVADLLTCAIASGRTNAEADDLAAGALAWEVLPSAAGALFRRHASLLHQLEVTPAFLNMDYLLGGMVADCTTITASSRKASAAYNASGLGYFLEHAYLDAPAHVRNLEKKWSECGSARRTPW